MVARTRPVDGLAFGGDVNPEQWDATVLDDDIRLMGEAGVNLVTLGVFSWATLEPREGEYDFSLFDRAIEAYHAAGIAVDLATPTAAPPIWLHQKHPEILPVTRTGQRYAQGGRLGWCSSSPVWRRYAESIVTALAERYGSHPAVRLWHLGNELGGGNRHCYCDESARAFRDWLRVRHGDIDTLNAAWGTAFWGHHYTDFEQVLPPRDSETIGLGNPGLVLDFDRFSSDALLEHYLAEKAIVLRHSGETPITTNFMVGEGSHVVDYARWAREVDIVANDHYLLAADPERAHSVAFAADRTRGLAPSTPWMLMETAASAVSWQPINRPPEPGELRRTAFTHLGRGADGVLFFQWRQSLAGAEQFHSAMVPHAGADSPTFLEVTELGRELALAAELAGAPVAPAQVAVLADDESGWAWKSGPKPLADHALGAEGARWHRALWSRGIRCDILPPAGDLASYDVIVVPSLFLVDQPTADALAAAVARGATVIVTRLSGIVDENNAVVPGGYPGRLAELLGVRVLQHVPLLPDETITLAAGDATIDSGRWAERLDATTAETVWSYADDAASRIVAGRPAVTRRDSASGGSAWYVSAEIDDAAIARLLELARPGLEALGSDGLDVVRRGDLVVAINHSPQDAVLAFSGTDVLRGRDVSRPTVAAGDVLVLREGSE